MRVFAAADAAGNAALETVHSAPTNDRATNLTNDQEQTTLVAVTFSVGLLCCYHGCRPSVLCDVMREFVAFNILTFL